MTLLDVLKITYGMVEIKRSIYDGAETVVGPVSTGELLVYDVAYILEDEVERISTSLWGKKRDVPCVKIVLKPIADGLAKVKK